MFHIFNFSNGYKRKPHPQKPITKLEARKEMLEDFFKTVNKTLELSFINPVFHHGAYRLIIYLDPYNCYPGIPIGRIENNKVFLDCNLIYKFVQKRNERKNHASPLKSKHEYFQFLFLCGAIKAHWKLRHVFAGKIRLIDREKTMCFCIPTRFLDIDPEYEIPFLYRS